MKEAKAVVRNNYCPMPIFKRLAARNSVSAAVVVCYRRWMSLLSALLLPKALSLDFERLQRVAKNHLFKDATEDSN